MSTRIPVLAGHARPHNLVVQLREAFTALNDLVVPHLVEHGFTDFRPAHGAVFQYLDDTGTTVSRDGSGSDRSNNPPCSNLRPELRHQRVQVLGAPRRSSLWLTTSGRGG